MGKRTIQGLNQQTSEHGGSDVQTAGQARGSGKHPKECEKARGLSSVETEEASASRPGGTLPSEARGKGKTRSENYPLGLAQPGSSAHKISFCKEVEKKEMC
jgi:hypothetical protein